MAQVQVLNVTRVSLSPAGDTSVEPIRLSLLDAAWICLPPIQRLFLYRTDRPLPSVAEELRASLSRTLPRFYSLAGRLTHIPDTGDVVIGFSGEGDDGVDVLEAEAAEGVEFNRLVEDEDHDVEAFSSLVPPLDLGELPAPVFSVQVTGFAGVGVAVGLSMHHMAADGKALWQFVEAWAAECGGGATAGGGGEAEPVLDRSVVRHPRAEAVARHFVRTLAPNLPKLLNTGQPFSDRLQLARRTFVVGAASIASLRDRGSTGSGARPSAFVALSAHVWFTFLRAKGVTLDDDQDTFLVFLADCRRRLDPPIGDGYFGNCVRPCMVRAKTQELLQGGGWAGFGVACTAIREAIDECLREPLGDCESWLEGWSELPLERMANVAASPRFRVYDADFGWGRPRRVELVSMNKDGEVALVAARDEEGGVQATVALSPLHMDRFGSLFLDGL